MNWTESDLAAYTSRTLEQIGARHGLMGKPPAKKPQGEVLRLILPFKLPTWNQLLAMDHWQRRKVRTWIKERVSECIANGEDLQTPMGSARRLSLTALCLAEYSEMIQPNSSKKYRTAKKSAKKMKR